MDIIGLTIEEAGKRLRSKEVSSVELTEAYLSRIDTVDTGDDAISAYIHVARDLALASARAADARIAAGKDLTPLTGIPVGVKDIFSTKDMPTTCASKILEDYTPPYDSTVIAKLKAAGAVIIGKLNMDEFAMGSSTENSAFGKTRNPWNKECVPGGSSGGSAAAVSASTCVASIGTDTGGSIRQPAALCGVVGLKPTYGRVSRYGMIAFASSLDQGGPFTKSVRDAAIMLNVVAGHDPKDSTSLEAPVPNYTEGLDNDKGVKGLKIGIPKEYFIDGIDPEVRASIDKAIEFYKKSGAELIDITLPHTEYAVSVYYLVATAEASSNLARYDGVKFGVRTDSGKGLLDMYKETRTLGFGSEVKRRIMLGTYALSAGYYDAYFRKASQVRALIRKDFEDAFTKCDVILTPTSPTPAFKFGEKLEDPLTMYLSDIFTISCNLAGIPGISIPCGLTEAGLPIGLQLLGRHMDEATILRAAHAFEEAHNFHKEVPAI
ncbi:MAG: Asp-tRNA(Asn)/Glu-tRNA(Gln) amidotransferase subunit GatA [Deltaproteobacteria bacterium]|nr:Asp-tRNA(Asn)/Glu-tRNA(Gln) amidotransferase subunit GatA [Deltaproteobacteria bacterium]